METEQRLIIKNIEHLQKQMTDFFDKNKEYQVADNLGCLQSNDERNFDGS